MKQRKYLILPHFWCWENCAKFVDGNNDFFIYFIIMFVGVWREHISLKHEPTYPEIRIKNQIDSQKFDILTRQSSVICCVTVPTVVFTIIFELPNDYLKLYTSYWCS